MWTKDLCSNSKNKTLKKNKTTQKLGMLGLLLSTYGAQASVTCDTECVHKFTSDYIGYCSVDTIGKVLEVENYGLAYSDLEVLSNYACCRVKSGNMFVFCDAIDGFFFQIGWKSVFDEHLYSFFPKTNKIGLSGCEMTRVTFNNDIVQGMGDARIVLRGTGVRPLDQVQFGVAAGGGSNPSRVDSVYVVDPDGRDGWVAYINSSMMLNSTFTLMAWTNNDVSVTTKKTFTDIGAGGDWLIGGISNLAGPSNQKCPKVLYNKLPLTIDLPSVHVPRPVRPTGISGDAKGRRIRESCTSMRRPCSRRRT